MTHSPKTQVRFAGDRPAPRSWGNAFNVVMATGIVSIAARKFGLHAVPLALLALAIAAFLPLAALDLMRARRPLVLLRRARAPRMGLPATGFVRPPRSSEHVWRY